MFFISYTAYNLPYITTDQAMASIQGDRYNSVQDIQYIYIQNTICCKTHFNLQFVCVLVSCTSTRTTKYPSKEKLETVLVWEAIQYTGTQKDIMPFKTSAKEPLGPD